MSEKTANEIVLSTGVVLTAKPANPMVLLTVMTSHPRPKPPLVFIEQMGRKIENPDDPEYLERIKSWSQEQSSVMLDALILYGTELKSKPKGFPGPDEKKWIEKFSLLGLEVFPENADWRYLTWVKFQAVQGTDDLSAIRNAVGALSGVREADVKAAEDFPGRNENPG